ncbi:uncharacterized protein LOC134705065 isoform X1 [Mytilus trossulus]|uniref:uncharacterized protein LOC134705065 isoform X1 n=1 Tax=Mytilus trossulus TaxID=6551 RepID=UPI0030074DDC
MIMIKLLVLLLFVPEEIFSTVRVYKKTDTKNNAEVYCETNGAVLLGYSKELIEASISCSLTDVLVNRPWLQRTGCFMYRMTANKMQFQDNHLANCATFCKSDTFTYIGVQADMCLCYESLAGIGVPANCDAVNCPGNSFEQCGISHMIVYRKEKLLPKSDCQYVKFDQNKFDLMNGDCNIKRGFVCKEDNGEELIECVGETSTYPTVQTSSIVKASTEGLSSASSSNLALILGISLVVLVVVVIVLVIICFRMRKVVL